MPRQFANCRFIVNGKAGGRHYLYHFDGEPLNVGDVVKLPDKDDPEAWQRGEVMRVSNRPPPFPTKAILGIVPGEAVAVPQGDLFGGPVKAPSVAEPPAYMAQRRRKSTPYLGGGTGRNPNRLDDAGSS